MIKKKFSFVFFWLVTITLASGQPSKNGFQWFLGVNAPRQFTGQRTFVNDSTTVYLKQNIEERESIGLSYHRTINNRFKLFSQILISESLTATNVTRPSFFVSNGQRFYFQNTFDPYYKFLNFNTLSGITYNIGRSIELSGGLGVNLRNQKYKVYEGYTGGGFNPTIDDIAMPLSNDIINKVSFNFGYSVSFHLKGLYKHFNGFYLTARYQESLSNESKGFEYRGTKYPLEGRASSYSVDLGYRFVARREKIADSQEEKIKKSVNTLLPSVKNSITLFAGVNGFEYAGIKGYTRLANLNDSTLLYNLNTGNFGHLGITFSKRVNIHFSFYTQLIVQKYSTGLQLQAKRTVIFPGVGPVQQNLGTLLGYEFINFNNSNGLAFKINKYFSVSAGLGLTYKAKYNEFNPDNVAENVRDVATTLNSSIFRQWDANAGYAFMFHIDEFQAALRFHKNLSNEWRPFEYRGRSYQIPGIFDGIYFDVGYRFSW